MTPTIVIGKITDFEMSGKMCRGEEPTSSSPCFCIASARRSQARPYWHTGHSTVHVRCAIGHPGGPRSQNSNGRIPTALVTWLAHRTCPVYTGLSGAPYDSQPHQTASLVVGAINTPNHPPFIASKFSTSQPLTRARHSILDTPKRSNSLQFHTRL
jgi:hypothetical protein